LARIVSAIVKKACRGDLAAAKLILAYVEGMPHQTVDMAIGPNARALAEEITADMSPAAAARIYQRSLTADYEEDEGEFAARNCRSRPPATTGGAARRVAPTFRSRVVALATRAREPRAITGGLP
jgi:hypothetical protein